ncbi:MAG: epimerase [Denitrovibrio sp.]|nr:MAG: epimerase [Denitrovibrio sp.]
MKILITGATGFIGNHLINTLLKIPNVEIIASSRSQIKAQRFDWYEKVTFIQYDFTKEIKQDLYSYFDKPNILIHLAWSDLNNYKSLTHIEVTLSQHIAFINNIITNGLQKIIVTGTCFEYGDINGCISEDTPTNPTLPYSIAKDTLRRYIEQLNKSFSFEYIWLRLFYMYGPNQPERSLFPSLDRAIANNEKSFNLSGGEQIRDYLHITKMAETITSIALLPNYTNEVINCCSGDSISLRNLIEEYLNDIDTNIKLNFGYYPYPDYEPMAFWGDTSKLKKILGITNK